jgi:asparagine synthase (glutamine-hydrolysing)
VLARDPIGVKPLYYTNHNGTIAFASEIKALLVLPWISAEVDPESLSLYLAFRFVPSPRTLFRGIYKLTPGTSVVLEPGKPLRTEFFAQPSRVLDGNVDEVELLEHFRHEFKEAVRRQLMGDVPVGVLLSGGMDSASILALATQLSSQPVSAYTVGFEDSPDLDEVEDAALTARRFGALHEHVTISTSVFRDRFISSVFSLDEPIATTSVAPFDKLCILASRNHKVVLSGQGADEPFGGYLRHRGEKAAGHPLSRFLAPPITLASHLYPRLEVLERASRTLHASNPLDRFAHILALFSAAQIERLLINPHAGPTPQDVLAPLLARAPQRDSLGKFLYVDTRFGLADDLLLYTDKISMASSLEVRVPFLDLELLRFVESIPASLRVNLLNPKSFLKRALMPFLPSGILNRPKRNFSPPESVWRDSMVDGPRLDWLKAESAAVKTYLYPSEVDKLILENESGRFDRRRQLFALLAFEVWHRVFIDRREPYSDTRSHRKPPPRRGFAPSSDRPHIVTHFGPNPDGPGGMSSIIREYSALNLEGYRQQFVTTFHPDYLLHSLGPFLRASWKILSQPKSSFGIAHFHLSKGGSFIREGLLLILAHARSLPCCVSIHSGAFPRFMHAHPRLVKTILSRADRILVLSPASAMNLTQLNNSIRITVVPNLVHLGPQGSAPGKCAPRVLFGGDVSIDKGIDVLLRCWPDVLASQPECELVIAGPPRGFRPRPYQSVVWLGQVSRKRVFELLNESRVAVLPSRSEGMPMFVLEAMSMGRPVVASAVGTLGELLLNCGTVVPPSDPAALAHALLQYLLNPDLSDRVGSAARSKIEQSFSPRVIAGVLRDIYDSLVPRLQRHTRELVHSESSDRAQ